MSTIFDRINAEDVANEIDDYQDRWNSINGKLHQMDANLSTRAQAVLREIELNTRVRDVLLKGALMRKGMHPVYAVMLVEAELYEAYAELAYFEALDTQDWVLSVEKEESAEKYAALAAVCREYAGMYITVMSETPFTVPGEFGNGHDGVIGTDYQIS